MIVVTERSHRLDMVCMVMRNQDMVHRREVDAIFLCMLLERSYSYSYIYQQAVGCSAEIITITAATAPKRYKFQHFGYYFLQKYAKKNG
jgi:hypothetical protein